MGPTLVAFAAGLVVTALIVATPYLTFGVRSPSAHLVLESVDGCVSLLVAYLMHGRFVRRRRLQDLLLAQGLVLLAVAGFALTSAVTFLAGQRTGTLEIWLPLSIRVLGAVLIAAAAVADSRPAVGAGWRRWSVLGPVLAVLVIAAGLWALRPMLPLALSDADVPAPDETTLLTGHPVLLLAQGLAALCFFVAAIAFAVQSVRREDELLRWLGPACALAAFARVHYVLFPSVYTDWLYTGDLLRTGCYLLLLVGAGREMKEYWSAQSRTAVLDDRRRLARELHDGVIQELAYIRSASHAIPADVGCRDQILAGCDRALNEARAAVQALGSASDEPLGFALHRASRELAQRFQVDLEVDLDDSIEAEPGRQHELMRITREAVSNAVRHGEARRVCVRLSQEGGRRCLAIHDDGHGFDVAATLGTAGSGYGLTSMRERARALPGSFDIESGSVGGSVVTIRW